MNPRPTQKTTPNPILYFLIAMASRPLRVLTDPLIEAWSAWRLNGRARRLVLERPIAGAAGEVVNFPLGRSIYEEQYIDPDAYDNQTITGATIDLQATPYKQFDHFRFLVLVGDTDIAVDFEVQDSADDSAYATLTDADGNDVDITQIGATDDNKFAVLEVTTKGYTVRRYLQGVLTVGDGTNGADAAVLLQAYGFEGETPTPAASDRLELAVPATTT